MSLVTVDCDAAMECELHSINQIPSKTFAVHNT